VLELVHHFFIARNLFPPNVYKPLVGHRILGLGEDGKKVLGHCCWVYTTVTVLKFLFEAI
jgi:hypothetical protein